MNRSSRREASLLLLDLLGGLEETKAKERLKQFTVDQLAEVIRKAATLANLANKERLMRIHQ